MKIVMRKELDMLKPINLRKLSPLMKVYAGIQAKWHESKTYKTNLNKRLEQTYFEKVQKEERIKESLLALIFRELVDNHTLKSKDAVCSEITISISSAYKEILAKVIQTKDFLPYNVTFVSENPDLRKAFQDMPILIRISKKQF